MPELTCTKLVIYLDIQLFLIGNSPFSLQDTALLAPPNVICNVHLPNPFAKQTSKTTPPHVQTMNAERGNYAVVHAMSTFFYAVRFRFAPLHILSAILVIRYLLGIPLVLGLHFALGIADNNHA